MYKYVSTPMNDMMAVVMMDKRVSIITEKASFVHISFRSIFYEWILPLFLVENLKCSLLF